MSTELTKDVQFAVVELAQALHQSHAAFATYCDAVHGGKEETAALKAREKAGSRLSKARAVLEIMLLREVHEGRIELCL